MPYPASTVTLASALAGADSEALQLKAYAQSSLNTLSNNSVSGNLIIEIAQRFQSGVVAWQRAAAVNGMASYADTQKNMVGVANEFAAMRDAAINVRNTAVGLIPVDGSGKASFRTLNPDGSISVDSFSPAATMSLRTALTAFIASIE